MSVDVGTDPAIDDFLEPVLDELAAGGDPPAEQPPAEPARKPGPPPNPRSQRQRRLAKKAAAPPKRATPAKPAAPAAADPAANPLEAGASTILGWILQPAAVGGTVLQLRAQLMARQANSYPPDERERAEALMRRAVKVDAQGQALTLDVLAVTVHEDAYVKGAAQLGEQIPAIGAVLERVAKVGPYATIVGAIMSTGLQILCNHGLVPATAALGTLTPQQLYAKAGIEYPEPPGE